MTVFDEHPLRGWRAAELLVEERLFVDGKAYGFAAVREWGERFRRQP